MIRELDLQQKHLLQVEEMQRSDWLICQSASKFVDEKLATKPKFVAQTWMPCGSS